MATDPELLFFFFPVVARAFALPLTKIAALSYYHSTYRYLPRHHAANAGGSTPAHQETHCRVCDRIPGPSHKQDDGGIEGVQLEGKEGKKKKKKAC